MTDKDTQKAIHWQWRLANILVVEDDSVDCKLLEAFFDGNNLTNDVQFCGTIQSAAHYMQHHHVDLLFLDIELPDGNGLEFLSNQVIPSDWLARDSSNHYPVVIMSGKTSVERLHQAREQGVYIYMDKPLDLTKLHAVIRLLDAFHMGILLDETAHEPLTHAM
ncbi:MAG: response regulator [Rickettsiales bacterium]|nr:response regulator [Rickettsiales bacterium]